MPSAARAQSTVRWCNSGLAVVALLFIVQLLVGEVWLGFHIHQPWPLLGLLVILYGAKYAYVAWSRTAPGVMGHFEKDMPFVLLVLCLFGFSALKVRIVDIYMRPERQARLLTGDEPSYLLLCQSIVLDRDVNLWNDTTERGGDLFGYPQAGPHKATYDPEGRRIYSVHSPGFPLFLAPFFALGLKTGVAPRFMCATAMNLAAACFVLLTYGLAAAVSRNRPASFLVALAAAFSSPIFTYSLHIYPDLLGGLLVVAGALLIVKAPERGRGGATAAFAAAGLCIAGLPWLHMRFAIFSLGLFAAALAHAGRSPLRIAAAVVPSLVSAPLLMLCNRAWYGSPWQAAAYSAQGLPQTFNIALASLAKNLLAVLVDNGSGLLMWSPYLVFVPAGVWFCLKEGRLRDTIPFAATAAVYLPVIASFRDWHGGFCPPNRFMIPLMPFLAAWTAVFLGRNPKRLMTVLFGLLAALAAFFILRAAFGHYSVLYSKVHVLHELPLLHSDKLIVHLAPILRSDRSDAIYKGIAWLALAGLLNLYALVPRQQAVDKRGLDKGSG